MALGRSLVSESKEGSDQKGSMEGEEITDYLIKRQKYEKIVFVDIARAKVSTLW